MLIASKGHFFTQIPQPIHSDSEMYAILDVGPTPMHSLPKRTTGHERLHSCLHFFGLHLSSRTIAILVSLSDILQPSLHQNCSAELDRVDTPFRNTANGSNWLRERK
ncbi:hypothetical protein B484DRAFT_340095 [Ochromonadaceae sp. CCMP2298]|nr:hypothetical protein B484DRAFT_340095 [Ochromonadaceae sp. CCMP2298]